MNLDIAKMISDGESEMVEFKPSLSQKDRIMDSISAFSNNNGGTILIGVRDQGAIMGVDIGRKTLIRSRGLCKTKFRSSGISFPWNYTG